MGENLWVFFQVCAHSEKQLCKDDSSPPELVVSLWRSKAWLIPGWCLPFLTKCWWASLVLHVCVTPCCRGAAYMWTKVIVRSFPAPAGSREPSMVAQIPTAWPACLSWGASRSDAGRAKCRENKLLLLRVEPSCQIGVRVLWWEGDVAVSWVGWWQCVCCRIKNASEPRSRRWGGRVSS